MNDSNKFENAEKEIRSLLIAYRNGCSLSEFLHGYRQLIGQKLPSRELGFNSDIELLYAMPDAVKITRRGNGDYHLIGIADEKSVHIQKLVCKQKPASKKRPSQRIPSQRTPSRFNSSRTDPRYVVPPRLSSKVQPYERLPVPSPACVKENIISIVKTFPCGIKIDEILPNYEKNFGRSFPFQNYEFLSLLDYLESIPELFVEKKKHTAVIYFKTCKDRENAVTKKAINSLMENFGAQNCTYVKGAMEKNSAGEENVAFNTPSQQSSIKSKSGVDTLDTFEANSKNLMDGRPGVPEFIKLNLRKLIHRYPEGIWAAEFPSRYEKVSSTTFDLHSMGYTYLADFIDDVPDILIRKPIIGSKKDWLIYPFDAFESNIEGMVPDENISLPKGGVLFVDYIILNIKKILEGYPEGIKLDDFVHVYSINCNDPLYVKDLGFNNVEAFLLSIAERVPLKIGSKDGCKMLYLLKFDDPALRPPVAALEVCEREAIPNDAAHPDCKFSEQKLPDNFDFTTYIPVFTSSIAHPGLLYIQLQGQETSHALNSLYDDIEVFYNGPHSNRYLMKNVHIKLGASCIAFWPSDQHWYRAQIISIPSMEFVQVFYVDYGSRDTIPTKMLRYIKREYMKLPTQAIKSRIAFLKPPENATKWGIEAKRKLLHMCEDVSLMAKVQEIASDGVLSLILCDTNGDEDIYINDILLKEGFAASVANEDYENSTFTSLENPGGIAGLSPLQALQAQYYLQACASVAPSITTNEHFISLMRQLSYSSNAIPNSVFQQQLTNPFVASTANPFLSTMIGSQNVLMNSFMNSQGLINTNLCQPVNLSLSPTSAFSQEHFTKPLMKQETPAEKAQDSKLPDDTENDIFHDDEELFEQYCQDVCAANKRFVKRLDLGENYKIHIIVVKSCPHASSGDISALIWNNKESDYLFRRLQIKEVDLPTTVLQESGNEKIFQQLEKYNVRGIKKASDTKSSILLYPLKSVIKILNIFGHPSVSVRAKLTEEIADFNLSDHAWNDYSDSEVPESDDNNQCSGVTDDDKINRLCLYDLLAMKEGIRCRRLKMMNNLIDPKKNVDEIEKLEQLHSKVLDRIQEIKETCELFS